LRQEYEEGRLAIEYVPSNQQLADGLTKALQNNAFNNFTKLIGLVDIQERLEARHIKELEMVLEEKEAQLDKKGSKPPRIE
jgi:hypothetical protein